MSTESHKKAEGVNHEPRHADVSYEKSDLHVGSIYKYLIVLGIMTIAALVICVFILRFTTNFITADEAPPPVSREILGQNYQSLPPEPRLQGVPGHTVDPQEDL